MKLSEYARQNGISYKTAWRWWKDGTLAGKQMPSGTVILATSHEPAFMPQRVAIYVRVSSTEDRTNLDTQAERVRAYCAARGYQVQQIVKEVGSGLNEDRPKFLALLADPTVSRIVVEYKDQATRFGFRYLETLLATQGRSIEVVNIAETDTDTDTADLVEDLVALVYSFAARLYGQRRAKRATAAVQAILDNGKPNGQPDRPEAEESNQPETRGGDSCSW
jgi:putative resolvase